MAAEPVANPLRQLSLDALRTRASAKWREYDADVLPLWVAEMDVPLAAPIVRAVTDAVHAGDTGYAHGDGYAAALADFAAGRWGWTFPINRAIPVTDVMHGVVDVLDTISSRADAVVVNCPVYPPFYDKIGHTGRTIVEAPLDPDGRIDPGALEQAFARATELGPRPAYLLCNPHNPTGTVHTADELAAAAALAERHGVRVVADEIHAPLVPAGASFVPFLSVPGAERGFSVMSASKAWNLAGIKAAVVIAGAGAVDDLARIPEWIRYGASHLGVIAHTVALREGGAWLDALLRGLDENRRLLADLLAEHLPTVGYRPPAGTYLAWLDCRSLGLGDDPSVAFLERGRVAVNAGPTFGTGGAGHVRLNFATSPEILAEAVQRMAAAAAGGPIS